MCGVDMDVPLKKAQASSPVHAGAPTQLIELRTFTPTDVMAVRYRGLLADLHFCAQAESWQRLDAGRDELDELIAQKQKEKITAFSLNWALHEAELSTLESELDRVFQELGAPVSS